MHLHDLDLRCRFISPSPVATHAIAPDHGEDHDEGCDSQTPRQDNPRKTIHADTPVNGEERHGTGAGCEDDLAAIAWVATIFDTAQRHLKDLGTRPRFSSAPVMDESIQDFWSTP
jgi:hypothetical protein